MNFETTNSLDLETFWFPPSFISKSVGGLRCTADSCLVFCSDPSCSVHQSADYPGGELLCMLGFSPHKRPLIVLGQELPAVWGSQAMECLYSSGRAHRIARDQQLTKLALNSQL